MEYIALALSLVAVILCIVILTKVNKLLTMLRTPIFKKLTPDMNLKPSSRRPISAQEMAQRGERKENRQNNGKDRPAKENRENRENRSADKPQRDRNEQREGRGNRRDRRDRNNNRREMNVDAQAAAVEAPAAAAAPVAASTEAAPAAEARRPLAPRIPVETPAAPAAPVAAPAAPAAEPAVEAVETTFDPSKVRYGRRNVIKKAPELADEA